MLKYAKDSIKYIQDKEYDEFISNERDLVFSVFNLSQLGELVSKLDQDFLNHYEYIPWRAMKSVRHRIVHDYEGVNHKILWDIIKKDMPTLIKNLDKLLSEIE